MFLNKMIKNNKYKWILHPCLEEKNANLKDQGYNVAHEFSFFVFQFGISIKDGYKKMKNIQNILGLKKHNV